MRSKNKHYNYFRYIVAFLLALLLLFHTSLPVLATQEELLDEAEERKSEPVETNDIEGWPQGPAIGAESAILMEANTGAILYAKNIDEELSPASITKLMCCLVAIENCPLDEMITVNQSAINANDPDGSSMYLKAGEQLTLEELLYGILISSANEACNVVAEHIAGSIDAYVEMMNEKASELGCTHTHFVTTNGLQRDGHYTSAHDMARIGRAFFSHDILCRISSTVEYTIPETSTHETHTLKSKNKLLPGTTYAYDGLLGSKTGFTSVSRQTLVSCAERGDMRLVCVIMKEETPYQFEDTVALFDYGFSHFSMQNVTQYRNVSDSGNSDFFDSDSGLFGSTTSLIRIDNNSRIVLPEGIDFSSLDSGISYDGLSDGELAHILYSYRGTPLGSAVVMLDTEASSEFTFSDSKNTEEAETEPAGKVYINIYHVLFALLSVLFAIVIIYVIYRLLGRYLQYRKKINRIKKKRGEIVKSRSTLRKNFNQHAKVLRRDKREEKARAKEKAARQAAQPRKHHSNPKSENRSVSGNQTNSKQIRMRHYD